MAVKVEVEAEMERRERERERERESERRENEERVGRRRVQRGGRGRHLRAIIIIARHNSAGLSTSAGTDWAIGPRWLVEGGGRGAPSNGTTGFVRGTNDKKDFAEELPTA